jgi:hypothetical protein
LVAVSDRPTKTDRGLPIQIVNDKGTLSPTSPDRDSCAGMGRVGTAFHGPFEEDMGLLIGPSFIIHYPDRRHNDYRKKHADATEFCELGDGVL